MNNRKIGLDTIRTIAILFVILGHYQLNTHFSEAPLEGIGMYLQLFLLPLFNTGVPLFILLTGFLNTQKEYSTSYIVKIRKVIIPYLIISVITIIYRQFYLHEDHSIFEWITKIFDFTAIPYAWYVEMYIGLYLLIPFLNILYNHIRSKKEKIALIAILSALCLLPKLLNKGEFKVVPEFWLGLYPICYYYIGSFIHEYRPTIKVAIGIPIIIIMAALEPISNFFFYHGSLISIARTIQSPLCAATAIIIFLLFYPTNIQKNTIKLIITKISVISFEIYLVSYIYDSLLYPIFIEHEYVNQSQFCAYFPIIALSVFTCSFITAYIYHFINKQITR